MSGRGRRAFIVQAQNGGPMALLAALPSDYASKENPWLQDPGQGLYVFWELYPGEEKPYQGLPYGTLCALIYEVTGHPKPVQEFLLVCVYEHKEEGSYPRRWSLTQETLPEWLQPLCRGNRWGRVAYSNRRDV